MSTHKIALFPRSLRQLRAGAPARSILMYFHIHCGSPRGASLRSRKNHYFSECS